MSGKVGWNATPFKGSLAYKPRALELLKLPFLVYSRVDVVDKSKPGVSPAAFVCCVFQGGRDGPSCERLDRDQDVLRRWGPGEVSSSF